MKSRAFSNRKRVKRPGNRQVSVSTQQLALLGQAVVLDVQVAAPAEFVDEGGERIEAGVIHADFGILRKEAESPSLSSKPERIARGRELRCGDTFVLGDHIVECQPPGDLPDRFAGIDPFAKRVDESLHSESISSSLDDREPVGRFEQR